MPNKDIVSTRNLNSLLNNPHYKEYYELKQEVLKDYPIQKNRTNKEHRECVSRIADLIFDIRGPFQEFVFSQVSEIETMLQERKANPKKCGRKYNHDPYD